MKNNIEFQDKELKRILSIATGTGLEETLKEMKEDIETTNKYLRCRYCDISVQKEFVNAVKLKFTDMDDFDIKLDRYGWHCPVCNRENRGYEFTRDEDI